MLAGAEAALVGSPQGGRSRQTLNGAGGCRLQVLSVLAGVEAALVSSTTGWPELLVAQLLHVYPGLRPQAGPVISG